MRLIKFDFRRKDFGNKIGEPGNILKSMFVEFCYYQTFPGEYRPVLECGLSTVWIKSSNLSMRFAPVSPFSL